MHYLSNLSDLASERAVLAGLYKFGSDAYLDIADIVNTETFTDTFNQYFYQCCEFLLKDEKKTKIDMASILVAADRVGVSREIGSDDNKTLLRSITNFPIELSNVRKMAGRTRKLQVARLVSNQLKEADIKVNEVTGDESIAHILNLVEKPIFDFTSLLNDKGSGPERIGVGIEGYIQYLIDNPVENVGIPTPYKQFNRAIGGGLRRKTINVIGARPKVGKTVFGDNISLYIAGNGIPVLNLDTEMSKEDHWNRMLAHLSDVEIDDIETGKFGENEFKRNKVIEAGKTLGKIPYDYISIAGQPFEETLALMRRWIMKTVGLDENGNAKDCVIIYDYLKLMSSEGISKSLQEYQVLGFHMTALHNFMVRYSVPCLALMQLNRDGINKEDTDVASGSDRIIWLCSNFSIFKKKTEEEIAEDMTRGERYNRKLVPIVARHGKEWDDGDYINMKFLGSTAKILEGKLKSQVANLTVKNQGIAVNDSDDKIII